MSRKYPALTAIIALWASWSLWFIARTSFQIKGQRFFTLFDDAMVSMTYARNLVEGFGLNWAREGAPVEGFTTPLWTLLMVPINASGIALAYRSLFMQLLSLLLLAAHLLVIQRLASRFFSLQNRESWLPAVILTATYYPLNYWALMGMETGLQTLLASVAVLLTLEITEHQQDRIAALGVILAAGYLTRMDMALLAVVLLGWIAVRRGWRYFNRRGAYLAGATLLGTILGYQLFRAWYFHDLLPNTYYLKLSGIPLDVRLLRGLLTHLEFQSNAAWLLAPVTLVVLATKRLRTPAIPLLLLLAVYSAYSIYIGGDSWELPAYITANRFLAFVMPLLFVLFAGALQEGRTWLATRRGPNWQTTILRSRTLATGAVLLAALLVNGLLLSPHQTQHWRLLTLRERPLLVSSHAIVLGRLRQLQTLLPPNDRLATFWAGIPAYFTDFKMVDMYGYNDRHIAHQPSSHSLTTHRPRDFRPGHMKWDYPYIFQEKHPDAFLQVWNLPDPPNKIMQAQGFHRVEGFWIHQRVPKKPTD